jgi:anti-anti-sigma factor
MPPFTIKTKDFEGVRILTPEGEIDARAARDLQKELLASISQGQRSLLVDLAGVETVAAAGLRVFVAVGERLAAEGGGLALCSPTAAVLKMIETAGIDRTLTFHRRRDVALEWLRDAVHQGRIARLAGRLLRKRDEAGRPPAGVWLRASAGRSTLAATLLGIEEEGGGVVGSQGARSGGGEPDPGS